MVWLTLRQFRSQAVVVFGLLLALGIVLAVTGLHLVHVYDTTVATCGTKNDCPSATNAFLRSDHFLQQVNVVILVVPALVGMFLGAPLVARELENNTYQLAWTQSVTRRRWLALKLGLVGLASMVAAGLLSLMVTWWFSRLDRVGMHPFETFDHRDIVPIGYAAFAFMLGVTAGVVFRRTLPAMATTFVAFIGLRLADYEWVRPNLITPLKVTSAFRIPGGPGSARAGSLNPADWIVSDQTVNAAGHVIGANGGFGPNGDFDLNVGANGTLTLSNGLTCPNHVTHPALGLRGTGPPSHAVTSAAQECIDKLGIKEILTYQPTGRYWALQWDETAIYGGLALALAAFCVWWVRRRLS
jgi:hypothetical protein